MVPDPLQLVGHVVQRQQVAQVARDRLLGGDRHADEPGHLALGIVDPGVGLDDVQGQFGVVARERLAGASDGLLDERPHAQDRVLDLLLLEVERIARGREAARDGPASGGGIEQAVDLVVDGGLVLAIGSFGHLVPLS